MAERTKLGKVFDASWSSGDREVRRICSLIIANGKAHVGDRPGFSDFKEGSRLWGRLESLGCDIEEVRDGLYSVSVEGARRCYRMRDFERRDDGDRRPEESRHEVREAQREAGHGEVLPR